MIRLTKLLLTLQELIYMHLSLCMKLSIEHSSTCDSRTNLNYTKVISLAKGGYVLGSVGLSVCLSVCLFVCGQH